MTFLFFPLAYYIQYGGMNSIKAHGVAFVFNNTFMDFYKLKPLT
jgi:hypothetical protein